MQEPIVIQEETEDWQEIRIIDGVCDAILISIDTDDYSMDLSKEAATKLRDALNMILNQK